MQTTLRLSFLGAGGSGLRITDLAISITGSSSFPISIGLLPERLRVRVGETAV